MRPPRRQLLSLAAPLALLAALAAACGGSDPAGDLAAQDDLSSKVPAPLAAADLPGKLDRATLRASNPWLTDAAFSAKWDLAKADSFSFLRAFAPAFHKDLAAVAAARAPGVEGLCLGDAHPENFGFMDLPGGTTFAPNDFDDSGYCPVAFDDARFFASVLLAYSDDGLLNDALDAWSTAVQHPKQVDVADSGLEPDWGKVHLKGLAKSVSGDRFDFALNPELGAIGSTEKAAMTALLGSDKRLKGFRLVDLAAEHKADGGSGGVPRYWILADGPRGRTLLEVKQLVAPALEAGRHAKVLGMEVRFDLLKKAYWQESDPGDQFNVQLLGGWYQVRDRLERDSPNLTKLSTKELSALLQVEGGQLGALHAKSYPGQGKALRTWMEGSARTLAARWKAAWKAAQKQ